MIPGALTNDEVKIVDSTGANTVDVNADGQMHVVMEGKLDTNNSTTATLGGGAVFTGTATNLLPYSGIGILAGSDVAGSLALQYSPDAADWHTGETYTINAGANKFFTPPAWSAYYRVVYTNGGAAQSTFYIHTVLKKSPIKWSSHNIDESITDEDDAELVKAVITGLAPSGSYENVLVTNAGEMKISIEAFDAAVSSNSNSQLNTTQFDSSGNELFNSAANGGYVRVTDGTNTMDVTADSIALVSDFGLEVAKGNVTNHSIVNKFGAAPDFDTGDGEVLVWDVSDDSVTYDNNDASKYLKTTWGASTTADIGILSCTAAGTQTIEIQGIGSDDAMLTQTFTLNGTTDVDLSATGSDYKRVFRMKNTSGTDLGGDVYVRTNGSAQGAAAGVPGDAATIRGMIQQANNQTEMAAYMVPTSQTAYLDRLYATTSGGSRSTNYIIRLYARPSGGVYQLKYKASIADGAPMEVHFDYPPSYAALTDLIVTAETTETSITGSSVIAGFDIVLKD